MSDTIILIDLSALAHQIWHSDTANPDPSRVSTQIVARVRALASAHPHAAICCDSGKSWRADVDPAYKAQRDTENRAPLRHQMTLACETLAKSDRFPVWAVPGFEGDDIIARAVRLTREQVPDTDVLIVTEDKDLLQLASDRVKIKNLRTGNVVGPEEVMERFSVTPGQMLDYLSLVGDKSDNILGAEGVGPVTAAGILKKFGALEPFFAKLNVATFPPDMKRRAKVLAEEFAIGDKQREALMEFQSRWPTVRRLVALRDDDDVEIPFHEIAVERVAAPMVEQAEVSMEPEYDPAIDHKHECSGGNNADRHEWICSEGSKCETRLVMDCYEHFTPANEAKLRELNQNESLSALGGATQRVAERIHAAEKLHGSVTNGLGHPVDTSNLRSVNAPRQETLPVSSAPVDFSQQLEPRTMPEAIQLAQKLFASRLALGEFGQPDALLAVIIAGREIGLPAMASLRAFHIIKGRPTLSASTMLSMVLKSGLSKHFRCTERTTERATFVTQRGDDPPVSLTYTMQEAEQAGLVGSNGSWKKNPADMLVARASSKLARLVYPDVVSGLYAPEEME